MNMPGFNADISIYKSTRTYFGASLDTSADGGALVQPQLRKTDYECVHDCLEAGGGGVCNFFCTENVDEGGGPSKPTCRPSCGRCIADEDSPTGRSRVCIDRQCDDYTRSC